jgi:DNA-binding NarL/FixJ family response regulator
LFSPDAFSVQRIQVLVADADPMGSQLIAGALKRCRNQFDIVALTSNSSDAILKLNEHKPDVAVISAELQDGPLKGFKVLNELRVAPFKTAAIMLLRDSERNLVIDAFRSGARGVFLRVQSFKALSKCIRIVHKGEVWASHADLEFVLEALTHLKPFQLVGAHGLRLLTRREEDVVRLVAEGMRNLEIAQRLNVTEHTVRNYLFRIFEKLGVSSRVELVLYAFSKQLRG